ncbi:hypothetical protein AC629_08225 [Bradyrhizobium sp. NAS80.1]|nr:hypothetical protein AC629_08225 [Bradyrhizobium sp. NAS80.1]
MRLGAVADYINSMGKAKIRKPEGARLAYGELGGFSPLRMIGTTVVGRAGNLAHAALSLVLFVMRAIQLGPPGTHYRRELPCSS